VLLVATSYGLVFWREMQTAKSGCSFALGFKVEGSITFRHICALEDCLKYYTLMNYCMPSNGHNNSHNQMCPYQI